MPIRWIASSLIIVTAALNAADPKPPEFAPAKVAPVTEEDDLLNRPLGDTPPPAPNPVVEKMLAEDEPSATKLPAERPPDPTALGFFGSGMMISTLSLEEAIRHALLNNLEARIEKVGISVEDARVRNAYGVFDPEFSFSAVRSRVRTPDNQSNLTSAEAVAQLQAIDAQIAAINANTRANQEFTNAILQALGRPPVQFDTPPLTSEFRNDQRIIFDQQSDQGEISLQARTPIGTVLRASARMTKLLSTFEGDPRDIFPNYLASGQLEFRQPLLRDFGFSANLAEVRIARKNREAQELTWKFRVEATLQSVVSTYYEMLFGLADMRNKGDAIIEGLKLVAHSQRRQELGFFSPYEVKQAQVQLSFDRENLLLAKNVFLTRQFAMKRLVLATFETDDRRVFLPKDIPSLKIPSLNQDELLALAFQHRLDYRAAILAAEAEDVRLKFARNQLWPRLDVVGSYGWNGLDSSYPSAYGQALEGQADQWQIGVTGGFPLGGIQPRAQLDAAKARKEQAILRVKSFERDVGVEVQQTIEAIRTNQGRLETARQTREFAAEAVRVGFRRMEEGLISNFDLIEQQRRFYDARTRELAAVAELNKSITQLWLATGTVLQNLNVTFGEAPNGKAVKKPRTAPAPAQKR